MKNSSGENEQEKRETASLPRKLDLKILAFISLLGGASCVLAGVVLYLNVVGAPLFFDEYVHAHYLWLVSTGHIPHQEFWCHYPALGYVITLPYFWLLPESSHAFIALRLLVLGFLVGLAGVLYFHARHLRIHWVWGVLPLAVVVVTPRVCSLVTEFRVDAYAALMAILALTVMFKAPTFRRSALAVGLSVLSVVVMPKYIYPLFLANLAYIGHGCLKLKRVKQSAMSVVAGASAALLLSQCLLLTSGTQLWEDVYWTSILMQKFSFRYAKARALSVDHPDSQVDAVAAYFSQCWWVGVIILLGVVGWFLVESRKKGVGLWTGSAVIGGVILSWVTCAFPSRQYLVPGLFCLVLFTPYIGALLQHKAIHAAGALLLVALLTQTGVTSIGEAATKLASGAAFEDFLVRQALLNTIPRSERVVGFDRSHPCFREDQTFVTWDETKGTPPGFTAVIPESSPAWSFFQPEHLAKSLERSPPASIAFMANYPPGWNQVLEEFVRRHADEYKPTDYPYGTILIRKDLLESSPKAR